MTAELILRLVFSGTFIYSSANLVSYITQILNLRNQKEIYQKVYREMYALSRIGLATIAVGGIIASGYLIYLMM